MSENSSNKKAILADTLTDVSIREGSQQAVDLRSAPLATKLELLNHAANIGVKRIEVTAFAPGAWYSDAEELIQGSILQTPETITLRALYFNTRGLIELIKHPRVLQEGIFLTAATAKYREKNYGQRSVEHAEVKMKRLITAFKEHNLKFDTLVLSTAWGECDEASLGGQTLDYLSRLMSVAQSEGFPIQSVTLGDTMGCATPEAIESIMKQFKNQWPGVLMTAHLHPLPGTDEECIIAAMEGGADRWEASWCGLGGSPFADEAGGNLDIRRLIKVYDTKHLEHGFDEEAVDRLTHFLRKHTQRDIPFSI